jgi:hypothetical protein
VEAKSNVSKRLEFIQNETCVLPPPPVHPPLAPRLTVRPTPLPLVSQGSVG